MNDSAGISTILEVETKTKDGHDRSIFVSADSDITTVWKIHEMKRKNLNNSLRYASFQLD